MYTVLFCVSATGQYMAPLTVYKGKNLYDTWTKGDPDGAIFVVSTSGWMQDNVFEKWIEHFIHSISKMKRALPVLLIFDGHGSHLTYGTVKKALDNQVILLCLPPNTSHALQPLDVGVFGPLKLSWKNILKNWYRESRLQNVSKAVFPSVLNKLFEKLPSQNAVGGFKGSGLFPPKKEVVYKRVLENYAAEPNQTDVVEAVASTSNLILDTSRISATNELSVALYREQDESRLGSPFKHIEAAIISTLSPAQSTSCKDAMKNAQRKRTRMQRKTGEILTTATTLDRHAEKVHRENKTTKMALKKQKKNANFSSEENTTCSDSEHIDNDHSLKVGKWVQVEFLGEKTKKIFHGIILSQINDAYIVKFAKQSGSSHFVFPEIDDISEVDVSQIVKVLPEPEMNHRGQYFFL